MKVGDRVRFAKWMSNHLPEDVDKQMIVTAVYVIEETAWANILYEDGRAARVQIKALECLEYS